MTCLRCGYCCLNLLAVIVVDPKKGIREGNLRAIDQSKERCPHLRGDKVGEYSCAVHGERWYKKTPCFEHAQIESGNKKCRMGNYILNGGIHEDQG